MIARTLASRVLVSGVILALAFALVLAGAQVLRAVLPIEEAYNSESLIRLHILAHSDSIADQDLKLQVRDAILAEARRLLAETANEKEAWQRLQGAEERFRDAAQAVVHGAGQHYPVTLHLGRHEFPEKNYGSLTVPAGTYHALQVVIGEGRGHNWWCVLFPPLCLLDSGDPGSAICRQDDLVHGHGSADPEQIVQWRFKYLDGIYHTYSEKARWFLAQGLGWHFLSTAQLPIRPLLPP